MKRNYITHLYLLVDASGSMKKHTRNVRNVLNSQIEHWAQRAKELNQNVRASIYFFNEDVDCVVYDEDVNKIYNPARKYNPDGNTAFIDANLEAIRDGMSIPEKRGDHAHLLICISDGENNINKDKRELLRRRLLNLPDNWTVSCLVPNANGIHEAKYFGYPANNIQIWDANTDEGFEEATDKIKYATNSYLLARSSGLKSTSNLFTLDASKLDSKKVKRNLDELSPSEYEMLPIRNDAYIKQFVEDWTGRNYRIGSGYYELMKPETIQVNKNICVVDKMTGKVYTGLNARQLVDLPDYEIKVNPNNYGKYKIFVQSCSTNRKLIRGTQLLVLK